MLFNWKGIVVTLGILTVVLLACASDIRCSGNVNDDPTVVRIHGEIAAGKRAMRLRKAEELAVVARDLRVLAKRYTEAGEKRKAHRAIGAAQELDRKIKELMAED